MTPHVAPQKPVLIFLGPWPPPYGGISSHLRELLPAIARRGYQTIVCSYHSDLKVRETIAEDVRIHSFNVKQFLWTNLPSVLRKVSRYLKYVKPYAIKDILIGAALAKKIEMLVPAASKCILFTYDNDKLFLNPFIQEPNIKAIYSTIYADFYLDPRRYSRNRDFLRLCFQRSTKVLSCSNYCVNTAEEFIGQSVRTHVIYNNVDDRRYSPTVDGNAIREQHGIDRDQIVLMTMARVTVAMGVNVLLDAAPELLQQCPRLVIFICGANGEMSDDVARAAAENSRIKYHFNVPDDRKPKYYAACDIFTSPTSALHACMGISNIEAMMSGKPVVASMSGGHRETLGENEGGYLIAFENSSLNKRDYIESIVRLCSDDSLRKAQGAAARRRAVKLFRNEQIVDEHIKLIEATKLS